MSGMSGTQDENRRAERAKKLRELNDMLHEKQKSPTVEELLNYYSGYARFEDGDLGTEYCKGVVKNLGDDKDTLREKGIASFFWELSETKLEMGQVPENSNEQDSDAIVWKECENWNEFLPDDTEFQLTVPEFVLWKSPLESKKSQVTLGSEGAFVSLEFDPADKGDVLWKLQVPEKGFPVGEYSEDGTCILREHHRQVMFIAFSWLLQNGIELGLSCTDTANLPPAVVAAICGSAGIGKSRSLIFFMWFLLQKKSAFLLEAGRSGKRYFTLVRPRENTVRFLSGPEEAQSILETDRSVLCIVDPQQFQEGETPTLSPLLSMMGPLCFTSPSADKKHLPRGDKEATVLKRFWVSPWILRHLKVVGPSFSCRPYQLTNKEISDRFKVVGGVPRAIFRRTSYDTRAETILNGEIDSDAQSLFHAVIQDKKEELMIQKVPQAFLAYHSSFPFTNVEQQRNVWIEFLSQEGRKRYGQHLYEKFRTSIIEYDDFSSAGMFFERWVGSILASRQTGDYRLRAFKDGDVVDEDIRLPDPSNVIRYTDEGLLLSHLLNEKGREEDVKSPFPQGRVREAPRGTPVYDFAITTRWLINATMAKSHPFTKAGLAKLIARLGAKKEDPLNLVLFVLNEKAGRAYSKRGGEAYQGEATVPDVSAEQVQQLRSLVVAEYSNEKLRRVATVLKVPLTGPRRKRKRDGARLGECEDQVGDVPPFLLIDGVMGKLLLSATGGTKQRKWQQLVSYVEGLEGDDPFHDMKFDPESVKQHVVTLVPSALE